MAMQPIASLILLEQCLPKQFFAAGRLAVRKARPVAVLALGLALVPLPPQAAFGQSNSQQEQQQREQQQRDEQQREQQQRDQQQREQQQREQQQREEQQREQQQRDQQQRDEQQREQQQRDQQQREQQQREQQQRDQQQREQQQREQQQREQQQREQQQRDQQQREEQQRQQQQRDQQQREEQQRQQQQRDQQQRGQEQREQQQREQQQREALEQLRQQRDQDLKTQQQREQQARDQQRRTSDSPVPSSKPGAEVSHATAKTLAADGKRPASDIQTAATERKPDTSLPIKPAPRPIEPKPVPEVAKKTCKDGPCQPCSSTQSKDKKDGSCAPEAAAKNVAPAAPKTVGPQTCAAGQVWNGNQCLVVGAQPCTPGQSGVGSCQVECATAFTAAQGYIDLLRSARQERDAACLKDPTSRECFQADADYNMSLSIYRGYLGSVPIGCQSTLPDPAAI